MRETFCLTNGYIKYVRIHLIIELWNTINFPTLSKIRKILKDSVNACKSTLLKKVIVQATAIPIYIDGFFSFLIGYFALPNYLRRVTK